MAESKPTVLIPEGDPPRFLQITDLKVGSGAEAMEGFRVRIHYVGVSWLTGRQFDASWDRFEPHNFHIGSHWEIEGLEKGVQGMRVGGRRKIVVPPNMGYREPRYGLTPGETLVFVVDLLDVV